MTEADAVQLLLRHFESLFPKTCANCQRQYATLRDYVRTTMPIGPPQSFDAELGNWRPAQPIGSLALSNCSRGTTLALDTELMPLPDRLALLEWIRTETERRGVKPADILEGLRAGVRRQVLK